MTMISIRRLRMVALALTVGLVATGCYSFQAQTATKSNAPVPWFCNPTAPNSVTGPGMGSVNWYAQTTRAPLGYTTCENVAAELDQAKAYAKGFPTRASAEANGFTSTFGFIAGMGTHHGKNAITPALLADPNFDPQNPIIPNSIIDDVFDPKRPEFLQYNGDAPDAALVGMSYYVRTDTGLPPTGFPGNNDWWHHHLSLCMDPSTAQAFAVNTSDAGCSADGGINVHLQNYYMLHVWLVDNLEYVADVHAPYHPCITGSGAIFDMNNPCHQQGSTSPPSGGISAQAVDAKGVGFCPIGQLGLT
jgi:hypothetical protein